MKKLNEGGPRRHISPEIKNKFIHAVLLMPEAEDRQSEVDEIFEEIKQANVEAWMKAHPELNKQEAENKVVDKMSDQMEDKLKENNIYKFNLKESEVAEYMTQNFGDDPEDWDFDNTPIETFTEEDEIGLPESSEDEIIDEEIPEEDIYDDIDEEIEEPFDDEVDTPEGDGVYDFDDIDDIYDGVEDDDFSHGSSSPEEDYNYDDDVLSDEEADQLEAEYLDDLINPGTEELSDELSFDAVDEADDLLEESKSNKRVARTPKKIREDIDEEDVDINRFLKDHDFEDEIDDELPLSDEELDDELSKYDRI